jgi:hypothetical protein
MTNRVYIDRHGKATPRLKRIMAALAERKKAAASLD